MLLPSFITNVMVMIGAASATENLKKKNMILSWRMKNNSKPLQEVEYYDLDSMEEATLEKGNHLDSVHEATLKDGNYPFQYAVGCKTQKASYYSDPKNLYLNYQKKFQNSTFNLNFLSYPNLLTSCQVKTKAETYFNYTTGTYQHYKTAEKRKEVKVKEEEEERGGEVRKGGRKTKKEEEGEKKRKETEKEKEDLGSSWPSWTRSGSDLQEGHPGPRSRSSPRSGQRKEWPRCTADRRQSRSQSKCQGPPAEQSRQRQSQKPRQGPNMKECGWTLQSNHRSTDQSLRRKTAKL